MHAWWDDLQLQNKTMQTETCTNFDEFHSYVLEFIVSGFSPCTLIAGI